MFEAGKVTLNVILEHPVYRALNVILEYPVSAVLNVVLEHPSQWNFECYFRASS